MQLASWSLVLLVPPAGLAVDLTADRGGFLRRQHDYRFCLRQESVPSYLSGTISEWLTWEPRWGPMLLQPAVGWVLDPLYGPGNWLTA